MDDPNSFAKAERAMRDQLRCKDCKCLEIHVTESRTGLPVNMYAFCTRDHREVEMGQLPCLAFCLRGSIRNEYGTWVWPREKAKQRILIAEDGIRANILWFALQMEAMLREDENRGEESWMGCDRFLLYDQLKGSTFNLRRSIGMDEPEEIIRDAARTANYAMMIADRLRREE